MKPRLLHLIGSFHCGGSERQAIALADGLRKDGSFDVYLATLNPEGILRDQAERAGFDSIPVYSLTSLYDLNFVRQVCRAAAFLSENDIAVIHTHDFYTNVFGIVAATLAGTRVKVASKRETGGMRSRSQSFVEKLAFSRADRIVANSEAVDAYLLDLRVAGDKITVIYNGLDTSVYDRPRSKELKVGELSLNGNSRIVTLVANLRHEIKNVPMFLRAAKTVAEVESNAHFVIAGEGGLKDQLEAEAIALGLDNKVHFIGRCDDIPALLAGSDVCVLTSTAEGFSNSILEYMAAGRPVVATNVGGAAEVVVEGETGHLVASDDDAALSRKLIELLSDKERSAQYGSKARRVVNERFSRERQVAATVELYKSLL